MRRRSQLDLAHDVAAVREVAAERRWDVRTPDSEARPEVVEVALSSKIDGERYWLRFRCPEYPEPCSILPIDPETGNAQVRSAWPQCEGFRPTTDLCMPLSSEGYALHPAWRDDPATLWNNGGNPLLRVIEELQFRLNDPAKYKGRSS